LQTPHLACQSYYHQWFQAGICHFFSIGSASSLSATETSSLSLIDKALEQSTVIIFFSSFLLRKL